MKKLLITFVILTLVTAIAVPSYAATENPFVMGDLDGDGEFSMLDLFRMKLYLSQKEQTTYSALLRADFDNDGSLSMLDSFKLKILLSRAGRRFENVPITVEGKEIEATATIEGIYADIPVLAVMEAFGATVERTGDGFPILMELDGKNYVIAESEYLENSFSLTEKGEEYDYFLCMPGAVYYCNTFDDDEIWIDGNTFLVFLEQIGYSISVDWMSLEITIDRLII